MKPALLVALFLMFAQTGFAQTAKAKKENPPAPAKAEEVKQPSEPTSPVDTKPVDANKAPGEDVDEVITNKKMRAESGSKSKFSISNSITYSGGTVEKPLSEIRPNLRGGTGTTTVATLTDTLSFKYNFTQKKALLLGMGLRWITPFYGTATPHDYSTGSRYGGKKFDIDNPVLTYQYIYKWYGIQSVLTTGVTWWTRTDQRKSGYVASYDLTQNNVYQIGQTNLSAGLLLNVNFAAYDSGTDKNANPANQSSVGYGAYPFAEYAITDRLHLRTITGLLTYERRRGETPRGLTVKTKVYQSIGLGISVTRNFYLYPNIQFLPDNVRPSLTNVAINANLNLF